MSRLMNSMKRAGEANRLREAEAAKFEAANSPTTETPISTSDSFQARVQPWMMACFGPEISADRLERSDRFIEEALELVQASDYPQARVLALVDYVYGRDQGDINQEVGGVMVTLAAHCLAFGVDMHEAGETELARIWTKVDQIRAKQQAKPHGSALPIGEQQFDPAPGVDLTDAYADRMAVRVERDKIAEGEHLPTTATPTLDKPGRQTTAEMAALAGRYVGLPRAGYVELAAAPSSQEFDSFIADVRRLAASVLSQVNG
jgi:NTP pyrophosphatase (non-canonical NTP hydrolase)